MDKPGLLGIAERLLEVRASRPTSRPTLSARRQRVRAADTEAVELADERRRALKTVSGGHRSRSGSGAVLRTATAAPSPCG